MLSSFFPSFLSSPASLLYLHFTSFSSLPFHSSLLFCRFFLFIYSLFLPSSFNSVSALHSSFFLSYYPLIPSSFPSFTPLNFLLSFLFLFYISFSSLNLSSSETSLIFLTQILHSFHFPPFLLFPFKSSLFPSLSSFFVVHFFLSLFCLFLQNVSLPLFTSSLPFFLLPSHSLLGPPHSLFFPLSFSLISSLSYSL